MGVHSLDPTTTTTITTNIFLLKNEIFWKVKTRTGSQFSFKNKGRDQIGRDTLNWGNKN